RPGARSVPRALAAGVRPLSSAPSRGGHMFDFDVVAVREAANRDGAFLLNARYWTAVIGLDMDTDRYEVHIRDGKVSELKRMERLAGDYDIRVRAPADAWAKL